MWNNVLNYIKKIVYLKSFKDLFVDHAIRLTNFLVPIKDLKDL